MSDDYTNKILFILESPGKVKTVQKYLGPEYRVESSVGHIRTLGKDNELGIDIDSGFAPSFNIDDKKRDVVMKLKKAAKSASMVYLASDWDREGEGIAWHIKDTLGLRDQDYYRVKFTEITEKAIKEGIANKGKIDMNMVHSQQSRQILDKLIGFKVSPCLWSEYANHKLSAGRVQSVAVRLLAEREREIETFKSATYYAVTGEFTLSQPSTSSTKISCDLTADLDANITDAAEVGNLMKNTAEGRALFAIDDLKVAQSKRTPAPPFITSSLQQEVSNKLGIGPDESMAAAQKLYEAGLITYMRTDSFMMSADALTAIGKLVVREYGTEYHNRHQYTKKVAGAQEAHEAIRPTNIEIKTAEGDKIGPREKRIYRIIWSRTVASQMVPAQVETSTIKIGLDASKCSPKLDPVKAAGGAKKYIFSTKFEKILFDGYLRVYNYGEDGVVAGENDERGLVAEEESETAQGSASVESQLEAKSTSSSAAGKGKATQQKKLEKLFALVKKGQQLWCLGLTAQEKDTQPPNGHYTEAGLVKKLEELKIGRPSTYASIISKIQERNYVEKKTVVAKPREINYFSFKWPGQLDSSKKQIKTGGEKNKLFITGLGLMIADFLVSKFDRLMDYKFTATVEEQLDTIAHGTVNWVEIIRSVWDYINPIISKFSGRKRGRSEQDGGGGNSEIALGSNPGTGREVCIIKTRNGWAICEKHPDDKKKSRWASIGSTMPENITLEQACGMLIYPRVLGKYLEHEIEVAKAKSIYLKYNGTNYSIDIYTKNNPDVIIDPENITLAQAIAIVEETNKSRTDNKIKSAEEHRFDGVTDYLVKNGPYGYYIKYLDQYNIPLPAAHKKDCSRVTREIAEESIKKYLGKTKLPAGGLPPKSSGADTPSTSAAATKTGRGRGRAATTSSSNSSSSARGRGKTKPASSGRGRGRGKKE